jgi:hypothetical protein
MTPANGHPGVDGGSGVGLCPRLQLPQRASPVLNPAQRGDRGLVRSWKRVQVLARRRDTGVAEALAHDLQVRSSSEQPGGVGMPNVLHGQSWVQLRCLTARVPHVESVPVT